uniref:hypothetical protein n=1 Tax=Thermococcus nautili TaxID=195522 RepID=UPI0018685026|nr:hypothetical protein [Thermococcus nautili]
MVMAEDKKKSRSWVEVAFYLFIALVVIWVFVRALKKSQNVILWNPELGLRLLEKSLSKLGFLGKSINTI